MTRPTLILFLRVPAIGRGKTRLARDIGKVEAWRLSRAMTAGVLRRVCDPRWRLVVRVTPDGALAGAERQVRGAGPVVLALALVLVISGGVFAYRYATPPELPPRAHSAPPLPVPSASSTASSTAARRPMAGHG